MSSNIRIVRVCEFCQSDFVAKTTVTKYCSHICARRSYKARKKSEKITKAELAPSDYVEQLKNQPEILSIKEREFLSIIQTANLIGTSKMTIYRMLKNNTLPYHKIGKRTIILRKDVNKLFGI